MRSQTKQTEASKAWAIMIYDTVWSMMKSVSTTNCGSAVIEPNISSVVAALCFFGGNMRSSSVERRFRSLRFTLFTRQQQLTRCYCQLFEYHRCYVCFRSTAAVFVRNNWDKVKSPQCFLFCLLCWSFWTVARDDGWRRCQKRPQTKTPHTWNVQSGPNDFVAGHLPRGDKKSTTRTYFLRCYS